MKKLLFIVISFILVLSVYGQNFISETKDEHNARMQWWRNVRFGMFVHWGLYAIPAGEWNGKTNYAEWIRNQAQIPLEEYNNFVSQFNPTDFNAEQWVQMAKEAGMKYIVITAKHHDGFCLFDSKYTDFDVMSTPFKRDILKELSAACQRQGIQLCFYYSIMDWHHPDYLPKRGWESSIPVEGADFEQYVQYMKNQLKELLTNYGKIGVLWFDGEWEQTWSDQRGIDLYNYVRGLQPSIIINNRVSSSRSGMEGFTAEGGFSGDFGTPEQQIPATGLPGVDWESCMTMNDHWGYNKNDKNFKSTKEIVRMLADIASKGGNYLLNVGPTAKGTFPNESISRLQEIGRWMKINSKSIYATHANPFNNLVFGRCTQKGIEENTRLYFHIFDWPKDGQLVIPGIYNKPLQSYLLSDVKKSTLESKKDEDAIVISVPSNPPDSLNSVVVLDILGKADINNPPAFQFENSIFIDSMYVELTSDRENIQIRYTTDGNIPNINSMLAEGPIKVAITTTISARCFRNGNAVSGTSKETFTQVEPIQAVNIENPLPGIRYNYYEGDWETLPDFDSLQPIREGILANFLISEAQSADHFGFEYTGYIYIPEDAVYTFYTASDDGSRLYIGNKLFIDNDGLHAIVERSGIVALAKGYHPLRVTFFEKTGGENLSVLFKRSGMIKRSIPASMLFYSE